MKRKTKERGTKERNEKRQVMRGLVVTTLMIKSRQLPGKPLCIMPRGLMRHLILLPGYFIMIYHCDFHNFAWVTASESQQLLGVITLDGRQSSAIMPVITPNLS